MLVNTCGFCLIAIAWAWWEDWSCEHWTYGRWDGTEHKEGQNSILGWYIKASNR